LDDDERGVRINVDQSIDSIVDDYIASTDAASPEVRTTEGESR
jgi:hypothetical protein